MAQLIFSMDELVTLIKTHFPQNSKMQLKSISVKDKAIVLELKVPVIPKAKVSLIFKHYHQGRLYFDLESNAIWQSILKLVKMDPLPAITLNRNQLIIDLNQLLRSRQTGIRVMDITQNADHKFVVEIDASNFRI